MTAPTTYINVKILPTRLDESGDSVNNVPGPEVLRALEDRIQSVFIDVGIEAFAHTHQLEKAA